MKVVIKTVKNKGLVFLHSRMAIHMRAIIGMAKRMVKELFYTQVEIFIKDSGKMIKGLESEHLLFKKVENMKVNGSLVL